MRGLINNRFSFIWGGIAILFLSACSANVNKDVSSVSSNNVVKGARGRPVADPVAMFAVNSAPGQTGVVNLSGKSINVRIGKDYISAANKRCRSVILQYSNGHSQANAVCFNGSEWATVLRVL